MNCLKCSICCKSVVLEIDEPPTDELRWMSSHKGIYVYRSGRQWYVEFAADCEHLNPDKTCKIYKDRPDICRNHDPEECEREGNYFDEIYRRHKDVEDKRNFNKRRAGKRSLS